MTSSPFLLSASGTWTHILTLDDSRKCPYSVTWVTSSSTSLPLGLRNCKISKRFYPPHFWNTEIIQAHSKFCFFTADFKLALSNVHKPLFYLYLWKVYIDNFQFSKWKMQRTDQITCLNPLKRKTKLKCLFFTLKYLHHMWKLRFNQTFVQEREFLRNSKIHVQASVHFRGFHQ